MSGGPTPRSPIEVLPHRPPFLFVSEVGMVGEGRAVGLWRLRGDEDFFRGHFPGRPVVPGVLLAEALAQVAGIALSTSPDVDVPPGASGMIAQLDLRFHAPVWPPAAIILCAERVGGLATLHRFEVAAFRLEPHDRVWDGRAPQPAPPPPGGAPPGGRRPAALDGQILAGTLVLSVPGGLGASVSSAPNPGSG